MSLYPEVFGLVLFDLPDIEIDEAHREQVAGENGELILHKQKRII